MTQWFLGLGIFARHRKRIEITFQIDETWGIEWQGPSRGEVCSMCGRETVFIPPKVGIDFVQVDITTINALIEKGRIHFRENTAGERFYCLSSLLRSIEKHSSRVEEL